MSIHASDAIRLHDRTFTHLLSAAAIQHQVIALADRINRDYADRKIFFVAVLNGSFMFAGDLTKKIQPECRISFVKLASYKGTRSTGHLRTIFGLEESVFGQHVVIIEDIVDTGLTLAKMIDDLKNLGAQSIETVSLFRKKSSREQGTEVKYVGFELDNEFVVGYGLDYDGLGRNLPDVYQAAG